MDYVEVRPGLFLSGSLAETMAVFRDEAIDVVVNVDTRFDHPLLAQPPSPGTVLYLWVPIADGPMPQDVRVVRAAARFVKEQWIVDLRRVLVHCAAGINRSALVAARALMMLGGIDAGLAVQTVRAAHPGALTNEHFVRWLESEGGWADEGE